MKSLIRQSGYTLIELILVMVIVAILAGTSIAYISSGVSIYSQGVERQEAVAQARFLLQRLARELRHATPNSLRVNCEAGCGISQCLEFTPFKSATVYVDYLPVGAPYTLNAVDLELSGLPEPSVNDQVVINPTRADEVYDISQQKRLSVSGFTSSEANVLDEWQFTTAFAEESPVKRLYLLDLPVSFCIEGTELYRYGNYGFHTEQLSAAQLQVQANVERGLLAKYIANNLVDDAFFTLTAPALIRHAVLNINAQMQFNTSENLNINYEVHIPNVP